MNTSSLERKTVRPGNLADFSYYHSGRQEAVVGEHDIKTKKVRRPILYAFAVLALIAVPLILGVNNAGSSKNNVSNPPSNSRQATTSPVVAGNNKCSSVTSSQEVIVSISARHLWACDKTHVAYNSPVVTGIATHPDTITPTGSYTILAKTTDTTLTGSDSTGSWSDPVSYWMPFLTNGYGTYGFHDATWRSNSEFGNISPNSSNASHGCVELPLSTAKWLYNWSSVGTNVSIVN